MKDANKLGSPLRTQCKPPRTPYARWGEGSATRSTVEGDCSVWSSPVRQDCGASSARQAVQGGKLHLWMLGIHRDATSAYVHGAIVARIYATHNPGFLQKTFRLSHTVTCSDNPSFRNQSPRFCLWTQGRVVREAGSCQSRTCGAPVLCGAIHTCWGKPGREGPEPRGAHQVAHAAAGVSRVRSAQGCWHECSPGLPGGKQTKTPIFLFPIRRGYRKERSYCSISHSTTFDFH
jgi:hypothetical protein